eukprot:450579_1
MSQSIMSTFDDNKSNIEQFIHQYKLHKSAPRFLDEGLTMQFSLTDNIIQQKKFKFALSEIRKQNKTNTQKHTNSKQTHKRSISQINDDSDLEIFVPNNKRQRIDYVMTIFIKTLNGHKLKINCNGNDTIKNIKNKIETQTNIRSNAQAIIYMGKELNDDQIIDQCNIKNHSILHLLTTTRTIGPYIQVLIRTLTGLIFRIDCKPNDSIQTLKSKIKDICLIPIQQQRLIHNRRQLYDGYTLKNYHIQHLSKIYLVQRTMCSSQ